MTSPDTTADQPTASAADRGADLEAIHRRVINVVGHELRTPVTTIHGLASELQNAADLETAREVIAPALLRNADRLTRLLDDLLIAAGIETAIPVDVPGTLEVTSELRSLWIDLGGDDLVLQGEAVEVLGPLPGLSRALRAVLDNAMAYGSAPPEVRITTSGREVTIEVRSPGEPIHKEEVRLATEPFFRGERAVTTCPGLGMGLAIARAVVERAGGTLRFSDVDGGHLTTVMLPRHADT